MNDYRNEFDVAQGSEEERSATPTDWSAYLASGSIASEEFMTDVDDLPVQERTT